MRPLSVFRALGLAALTAGLLPQVACVGLPEKGQKQALATHVEDWRDEVIYQVLVDRFANGDVNNDFRVQAGYLARYQGGDWRGLEDHLDYIQNLGVTTLWISPIVKNVETDADFDAYHGYWAQDLRKLNPHFGDMASLRSLVASAHERGMKIVLDIVTNHMGQLFFYDMNLNGKADVNIGGTGTTSPVERVSEFDPDWDPRGVQAFTSLGLAGRAPILFIDMPDINRVPPDGILGRASSYHGFGRILNYDDEKQRTLGDFPGGLKDVATELPEVRAEMIDAYTSWVEDLDLDGFRIDTVKHVEHEFWQVFAKGVRERLAAQGKKRFLMFGEAFDGNDQLLGSYTAKGELDSVFYFSQHFQVFRDVFQNAHDPSSQGGTQQIADLWSKKAINYGTQAQDEGAGLPPTKLLVNFLDNHDVARFLFFANKDVEALRNALTLLLTEEGIPCIYYGTELDFAGGNDPSNREVLWKTGFPQDGTTFQHIAKITKLRKELVALRRGDANVLFATTHVGDEPDAGMFAFERGRGDAAGSPSVVIVLDTNAKKKSGATFKVQDPALFGKTLVDRLDPAARTFAVAADGTVTVDVDAQRAVVLTPQ
jgi:glycosidase